MNHHPHLNLFISEHQVLSFEYLSSLFQVDLLQILLVEPRVDQPSLRGLEEINNIEIHLLCFVLGLKILGIIPSEVFFIVLVFCLCWNRLVVSKTGAQGCS